MPPSSVEPAPADKIPAHRSNGGHSEVYMRVRQRRCQMEHAETKSGRRQRREMTKMTTMSRTRPDSTAGLAAQKPPRVAAGAAVPKVPPLALPAGACNKGKALGAARPGVTVFQSSAESVILAMDGEAFEFMVKQARLSERATTDHQRLLQRILQTLDRLGLEAAKLHLLSRHGDLPKESRHRFAKLYREMLAAKGKEPSKERLRPRHAASSETLNDKQRLRLGPRKAPSPTHHPVLRSYTGPGAAAASPETRHQSSLETRHQSSLDNDLARLPSGADESRRHDETPCGSCVTNHLQASHLRYRLRCGREQWLERQLSLPGAAKPPDHPAFRKLHSGLSPPFDVGERLGRRFLLTGVVPEPPLFGRRLLSNNY